MNTYEMFDQFYKKTTVHSCSNSLLTFFEENVHSRLPSDKLNILELGSGSFSLFEMMSNLNAEVTAIDFSANAILKAPQSKIRYKNADIVNSSSIIVSNYDLVFDSHCLNCITSESERNFAFKNIYSSLKVEGLFASELMIQPIGDPIAMPFKMIKSTYDLEQEILSHGFKIIFFIVCRNAYFETNVDGMEIKSDLLKLIAKK